MSEIDIFELIKKKDFDALIIAVENDLRLTQVRGEFGTTILHHAAELASRKTVKLLKEFGCDIHVLDDDNETPIWWAIDSLNYAVVDYLLEQGAVLDAMNKDGLYPLHELAFYESVDEIDFLLSRGVPVDQKTRYGWTAFHFAAMRANLELINFLVKQGANINEQDNKGFTPLHVTATSNIMTHHMPKYINTIKLLVESGADILSKTKEGKTAEEISYYREISQLLARYRESAS